MRSMKNQRIKSHIVWLAIISVTAILTSCGGDDPAKMEVINGISVPPEPDPVQNNATVAGVDVNSNGVRDDVERKIVVSNVEISKKMDAAKLYQKMLNNPSMASGEVISTMLKIYCLDNSIGSSLISSRERMGIINSLLLSTNGDFLDVSSNYDCAKDN